MRARRLLKHAVATCLAVVALAGCGDGGAPPQSLPPLTQSPTVTSPTPMATPTPTADDVQRSAEQFVRAYFREFDRANRDSDPSLLRKFYDRACQSCQYDLNVLAEAKRKGQHIEGYEFDLMKLQAGALLGNTVAVTIEIRHKPGSVVRDHDGSVVEQLPATQPVRTDIILVRRNNGWRILEIVALGEVKR